MISLESRITRSDRVSMNKSFFTMMVGVFP